MHPETAIARLKESVERHTDHLQWDCKTLDDGRVKITMDYRIREHAGDRKRMDVVANAVRRVVPEGLYGAVYPDYELKGNHHIVSFPKTVKIELIVDEAQVQRLNMAISLESLRSRNSAPERGGR